MEVSIPNLGAFDVITSVYLKWTITMALEAMIFNNAVS